MKITLTLLVLLFTISTTAYGQRLNEEYFTDQDVQIRFPGAMVTGEDVWHSPVVIPESISYSILPMGSHIEKVRLGLQGWEFPLQQDMIVYETCQFIIDVSAIPQGFRIMELRVRIREDFIGGGNLTGPWSASNSVRIIGKPGKPFQN